MFSVSHCKGLLPKFLQKRIMVRTSEECVYQGRLAGAGLCGNSKVSDLTWTRTHHTQATYHHKMR